jgi:putative hemolysin
MGVAFVVCGLNGFFAFLPATAHSMAGSAVALGSALLCASSMLPLLKGYLRCGARVLGAPAWDPDFNTADLPVMLRLADLPARYRRHFIGA